MKNNSQFILASIIAIGLVFGGIIFNSFGQSIPTLPTTKLVGDRVVPKDSGWSFGTSSTVYYGNGSNLTGITGTGTSTGSFTTTSINGVATTSFVFATSTFGNINLSIGTSSGGTITFNASTTNGTNIPQSASTTQWNTAFNWGNHSLAGYLTSVGSDSTWTQHNDYPAGCSAGDYVTAIGDTLTCATPSGGGTQGYNYWGLLGNNLTPSSTAYMLGVGTSTPASILSLWSGTEATLTITSATSSTAVDPAIAFRTGANPAVRQYIYLDDSDSDKIKIATSTTSGNPALTLGTDGYFLAQIPDNSSTSMEIKEATNSYLTFDTSNGAEKMVAGKDFEIGTINADPDSGAFNFFDMAISNLVATGTEESASIALDGNIIAKFYAESNGVSGLAQKLKMSIATSTALGTLTIVNSTSTASTTMIMGSSFNGTNPSVHCDWNGQSYTWWYYLPNSTSTASGTSSDSSMCNY